jgi:hypothetical protein
MNQTIFLPFTIPRFLKNTKPSKPTTNSKYFKDTLSIKYTRKMLPKPNYLRNYF